MALTTNQRQALRAEVSSEISRRREPLALNRSQLDAAIAAVDDWIEANAVSFNQALPTAARNNLTAAQKAELLYRVALRRYGG